MRASRKTVSATALDVPVILQLRLTHYRADPPTGCRNWADFWGPRTICEVSFSPGPGQGHHFLRGLDVAAASVFLLSFLVLAACTTAEQRQRAAENAEIKRQAANEVDRICALKSPEREAALDELKKKSGYELHCAEK